MDDGRSVPNRKQLHPLRRYRDRYAMTLRDLATKAGIAESSLSRIEMGKRTDLPSCRVIQALARATDHEVGEIEIFRWHFQRATGEHAI